MKQTVVVLSVVMALLLVVSGFIVAGSLRQSELLVARVNQVNELTAKLNQLSQRQREQDGLLETGETERVGLLKQRDALTLQLEEALLSAKEANDAIAQNEIKRTETEAAYEEALQALTLQAEEARLNGETLTTQLNAAILQNQELTAQAEALTQQNQALAAQAEQARQSGETLAVRLDAAVKRNGDLSAQAEALAQQNQALTAQEEAALQRGDKLEADLTAATAENQRLAAQQKALQQQAEALEGEIKAYSQWRALAAPLGGDPAAAQSAKEAFIAAYPNSSLLAAYSEEDH